MSRRDLTLNYTNNLIYIKYLGCYSFYRSWWSLE